MTIIADTSCLILLYKIGEFEVLKGLYGEVIITSIIANEYGSDLPLRIKIIDPINLELQNKLNETINTGEASALALAIELKDCKLILDDKPARKLALDLGLIFTGTLGVLIDAKKHGLIPSIKPLFDKIELTNFHYTPEFLQRLLESVGE